MKHKFKPTDYVMVGDVKALVMFRFKTWGSPVPWYCVYNESLTPDFHHVSEDQLRPEPTYSGPPRFSKDQLVVSAVNGTSGPIDDPDYEIRGGERFVTVWVGHADEGPWILKESELRERGGPTNWAELLARAYLHTEEQREEIAKLTGQLRQAKERRS